MSRMKRLFADMHCDTITTLYDRIQVANNHPFYILNYLTHILYNFLCHQTYHEDAA